MLKNLSPGFLLQAFTRACVRFPGAVISAAMAVVAIFVLIHPDNHGDDDAWGRMWMTAQIGIPFMTAIVVFAEDKKWSLQKQWIAQIAGALLLVLYWYFLDIKGAGAEYTDVPQYIATLLVAHLLVAVAPYFNKRPVRDFWEYNKQIFANWLIGAAFTVILFAGLSLAILAVDQLFNLNIDSINYLRLFVLLAGIFNTAYFLYHFPGDYSFDSEDYGYHFVFKTLCKFILIPIVGLYFVILYAYSLKILITWELPNGWVGSLVTGFSVAGIFTYLLNFYLPEQENSWIVQAYRRWFWWIVLPMTALLFVAISRRISDYGVTELRYLVLLLGIWLLLNCLYFLFSKKDDIKIIPVTLAVFALLWAYGGPFSAGALSEQSQMSRIKTILEQNGRFENGKIKSGTAALTTPEYDELYGAIGFFDRRERMYLLDGMLPVPVSNMPVPEGTYGDTEKLMHWLGIARPASEDSPGSVYFYLSPKSPPDQVDIRGFSRFIQADVAQSDTLQNKNEGYHFTLNQSGKYLKWYEMKKGQLNLVDSLDLQPKIKAVLNLQNNNSYIELTPEQSTFDLVSRKGTIRICTTNATIVKDKTGAGFQNINGFFFVK